MFGRFAVLVSSFVLAIAMAGAVYLARPGSGSAANELVVFAGQGEGGYAVNAFLPAAITVTEGTAVTWDFAWLEPHTVSLGTLPAGPIISTPSPATYDGTGFVTSDMTFGPGKRYTITFTTAGTYPYFCLIHPYHRGTVTVVDEPIAAVDTQATVDARGASEYATALGELKNIATEARAQPVETRLLADGSTERIIKIARATQYGDVQQFFPPALTVAQGDTITWRSAARSPHTVTLGPFPDGVPLPANPLVDAISRPGDAYAGEGYWNSGVLGIDWPVGTEFSLKFAKPGVYDYYCILHIDQGHRGTIEVLAPVTPSPTAVISPVPTATIQAPGPPATGTGTGSDATGRNGLVAATVLLLSGVTGLLFAAKVQKR